MSHIVITYCCCCPVAQLCPTLCDPMDCSTPGFPVLHHLPLVLKLIPLSQWCHPTISSSVVSFCLLSFPALDFSDESALRIRWPKYWNFSFNISPSNEYSGFISFRINRFDLLAAQGTLKSFQHLSSKASILRHSAFFIVQLSPPYMTTGKPIDLTSKVNLCWQSNICFLICCLGRS